MEAAVVADQLPFLGTSLLKIDEGLSDGPAPLASADFPGYISLLRTGWGAPGETASWFVHGNHYWDHSHADQGEVVLYSLGAPLSLDWDSTYEPRVDGAFVLSLAAYNLVRLPKLLAEASP